MRPRDLAQFLLASGELLPKPRLRNQSPDRAGLELKRRLLQRITEIDPESDQLDATLARLIEELGPPAGPVRALAVGFRDDWLGLSSNPEWLKQLSEEAAQDRKGIAAVADNLLRKWLSRKAPLPKEVEEAQSELARLSEKTPTIAELANQLSDLLPALYAEPVRVTLPEITQEKATEKLNGGVPLLRGETIEIDWPTLNRRLQDVVAVLAARRGDAASGLTKAIVTGQLDIATVTSFVLDGQPQRIHELAEKLDLDVPLTASVSSLVLFPVFVSIRTSLEPLLPGSWTCGYCPACGSFPKLGEFRGLEQLRFLRCNLCAAGWQFPRLQCACCGNRDHHQLGYLHVEGEEGKSRANTCEECRQYIKMVSTLAPLSPLQLLVTDVATVHLDLLAADKGYSPPM